MSVRVKRGTYRRTCRCGWTGVYDTSGKAAYAKRRHSCEKRLTLAARNARGQARLAAVDRAPKPCDHKQTTHVHGTYACYTLDACRCGPCCEAVRDYENNRVRQQAYGRWNGLVDAEPARQHVRELMAAGMGLKRIVAVSDVSQGVLWKLIYGKRRADGTQTPSMRIRPQTEATILAVELDLAAGAFIDGTGTRRRLQALVALGYSISWLGREVGVQNIHRTIHGAGAGLVVQATADRTAMLYERHSMTLNQPTGHHDKVAASRARNHALANGWLPPLAWDDDLIDDPTHQPVSGPARAITHDEELDEAAIYRRMNGDKTIRLSKVDAVELVARCRKAGWSWLDIERRAGLKPERYKTSGAAA